ncbi:hypothetical protein A3SI_06854 [Nitritalea halalkaliphila LW7]|uniref:Outer membrane protein beta-barrel domain-containing protein n=1 Tax=Nitritalea halalkaliphila LW7 TaxID=1189621 RepID=I5C632_9BACT|nr:hypothetical protein [Nitritalea halalkaliphila]EIM77284.1 hypothetical protein A3SI_06854 [Nitritalea halalkaliphila LW7]
MSLYRVACLLAVVFFLFVSEIYAQNLYGYRFRKQEFVGVQTGIGIPYSAGLGHYSPLRLPVALAVSVFYEKEWTPRVYYRFQFSGQQLRSLAERRWDPDVLAEKKAAGDPLRVRGYMQQLEFNVPIYLLPKSPYYGGNKWNMFLAPAVGVMGVWRSFEVSGVDERQRASEGLAFAGLRLGAWWQVPDSPWRIGFEGNVQVLSRNGMGGIERPTRLGPDMNGTFQVTLRRKVDFGSEPLRNQFYYFFSPQQNPGAQEKRKPSMR